MILRCRWCDSEVEESDYCYGCDSFLCDNCASEKINGCSHE